MRTKKTRLSNEKNANDQFTMVIFTDGEIKDQRFIHFHFVSRPTLSQPVTISEVCHWANHRGVEKGHQSPLIIQQ